MKHTRYVKMYRKTLIQRQFTGIEKKSAAYGERLKNMFSSEIFQQHNIYPTMNVEMIYAVIAMCLELKSFGLDDKEIIDFVNSVFHVRKKAFAALEKCINLLPNSYRIAEKWNLNDHEQRVKDGSITYDIFEVSDGKIEYSISKCMYVEMFKYYGIRSLCKIFCMTDENAYANLSKHITFIRHSDLSDGDCCHDEVIKKR